MNRFIRNIAKCTAALVCGVAALGLVAARAEADVLVTSSASHSIEWFNNSGTWIDTFASTGPRTPLGIAQSPSTKDVFVSTPTTTILRYGSNGQPSAYWDTFTIPSDAGANGIEGLVFDSSGNLYVGTQLGTSGATQIIYIYPAPSLSSLHPAPGSQIATGLKRGDQLAFDPAGNICIAAFIDETVRCFNPNTLAQVFDYNAEVLASGISPTIEPTGLAFDAAGHLYLNSTFAGQLIVEQGSGHSGPLTVLASGLIPEVEFLTLRAGSLYMPSYTAGMSSDIVYKINASNGAVTNFITSHVWGPYQMIFARVTKCH
jgi:streptogramin lyase